MLFKRLPLQLASTVLVVTLALVGPSAEAKSARASAPSKGVVSAKAKANEGRTRASSRRAERVDAVAERGARDHKALARNHAERSDKKARAAASRPLTRAQRLAEARAEKEAARREAHRERRVVHAPAMAPALWQPGNASAASARPSMGKLFGLHDTPDELELKSSVALVMDQDNAEVLYAKNTDAVLPIASLTKLMTAVVVVEARQSLDDLLEISAEDIDTEKGSRSRLTVGTQLTRGEMLHLALMSSENRAAHALGRYYPGGLDAAVQAMNRKAQVLGMSNTRYVEPTGLSSSNQSSAADLAKLVQAAYHYPLIRELSTSPEREIWTGSKTLQFRTTNGLVLSPSWQIGLQKTGYIAEAGRCLVMQAQLAGRRLIMVFLDSAGKYSRIGDAERVRHWLEAGVFGGAAQRVSAPVRPDAYRPGALPSL